MSWISPFSKTQKLGEWSWGYPGLMKNPRLREGDGLARGPQLLHPLGSLTETPGLVCFLTIGFGVTGPCIEHLLRTYCMPVSGDTK